MTVAPTFVPGPDTTMPCRRKLSPLWQFFTRTLQPGLDAAPDFRTDTPQRNMKLKNLRRFHAGSVIGPSVKREKSTDPPLKGDCRN
jgi:hypothetical protein